MFIYSNIIVIIWALCSVNPLTSGCMD